MSFFRQHERLRVPQFWKGEERSFATQLERILDVLFNRKIGRADLDAPLGEQVDIIEYETITTQTNADELQTQGKRIRIVSGENVLLLTNRPSSLQNEVWPFVLEIKRMGLFYDTQILYMYTTANSPPIIYYRQESYAGGHPVWMPWYRLAVVRDDTLGDGFRKSYVPGQTVTVAPQTICYGHITGDTRYVNVMVPCLQDVPQSSLTVSSVKMELRGPDGYVDIFTASNLNTEKVGTQGYTFNAYGIAGMARLQIVKSTAFTNVSNNVPITGYIQAMTFSIPY